MADVTKAFELTRREIYIRIPWVGAFHLFWTGMNQWAFVCGRCDYGTLVILVPGFWFAYSDPGLRKRQENGHDR